MKKFTALLMSFVLSISVFAQVRDSIFVSVPLDNTGTYTVDVLANGNSVYSVNVDVIQDDNYDNGVFSGYINVPSEVWSDSLNYTLEFGDNSIVIASVPFSSTAQYLADTKIINSNNEQVVRILANGKTLYVDAYDFGSGLADTYTNAVSNCYSKTITINNKTLSGSLPTILELKAIFNQSQYFECGADNKLHLFKYYWYNTGGRYCDITDEYYNIYNHTLIYDTNTTAEVRCVYK